MAKGTKRRADIRAKAKAKPVFSTRPEAEAATKTQAKAVAKKQPVQPAAPVARKAKTKEAKNDKEDEAAVNKLAAEMDKEAPTKPAPKKTKARRLEDALRAMEEAPDKEEGDEEGEEGEEKAKKVKKGKKAQGEPRGVIYLGHLPRGFFEPQLRKFFVQFGKVTRLRLSRSKKNAQSKGYAFVEFEEEDVAKIVSDTMTRYLLFGKQLVCHVVPSEKQHPALFKGCRKRMVNFSNRRRRQAREAYNKRPTLEVDGETLPRTTVRQESRRKKSDKKLKDLLVSLGVDYDPSMAAASDDGATDKPIAGKKRKAEAEPKAEAKAAPKGGTAAAGKAKAKAKAAGKKQKSA